MSQNSKTLTQEKEICLLRNKKPLLTNAIANAGMPRFHRDRLCSLKHLKSLHTFPDKSGQVVLADS